MRVADVNAAARIDAAVAGGQDPWTEETGASATHALCLRGRVGLLALLLRDHGLAANPAPSALGVAPLHVCARKKRPRCAAVLLRPHTS